MNTKGILQLAAVLTFGNIACAYATHTRLEEEGASAPGKAGLSTWAGRGLDLLRDHIGSHSIAVMCTTHGGTYPKPSTAPAPDVAPDQIGRTWADSGAIESHLRNAAALTREVLATLIMPGPVSAQTTSEPNTALPTIVVARS